LSKPGDGVSLAAQSTRSSSTLFAKAREVFIWSDRRDSNPQQSAWKFLCCVTEFKAFVWLSVALKNNISSHTENQSKLGSAILPASLQGFCNTYETSKGLNLLGRKLSLHILRFEKPSASHTAVCQLLQVVTSLYQAHQTHSRPIWSDSPILIFCIVV
jgi:hypothetical protein